MQHPIHTQWLQFEKEGKAQANSSHIICNIIQSNDIARTDQSLSHTHCNLDSEHPSVAGSSCTIHTTGVVLLVLPGPFGQSQGLDKQNSPKNKE